MQNVGQILVDQHLTNLRMHDQLLCKSHIESDFSRHLKHEIHPCQVTVAENPTNVPLKIRILNNGHTQGVLSKQKGWNTDHVFQDFVIDKPIPWDYELAALDLLWRILK